MVFRTLALCLLFVPVLSIAQGRKPAVEDFVGIEVEESKVAPHGSESLFNLEQDINKIEAQKNRPAIQETPVKSESSQLSIVTLMAITLALGLPMLVWFMVMSHLKKKASVESASNIEVLEKYRKDREKKSEEKVKKAS